MSKAEVKHLCIAIKEKYSIIDYADSKGIEMFDRSGRTFIVCPFHRDVNPSLVISADGKVETFYCFGCKKKGSIIDFYSEYEKISIGEAIGRLGKGIDITFDLSTLVKEFNQVEEEESVESEFFFTKKYCLILRYKNKLIYNFQTTLNANKFQAKIWPEKENFELLSSEMPGKWVLDTKFIEIFGIRNLIRYSKFQIF